MPLSGPHYRAFIWHPFCFHHGCSFNFNSVVSISPAILTISAMELDFVDHKVEAQMEKEEEWEITIRGARGGGRQQFDLIISFHPKTYVTLFASILLSCKKLSFS